MRYRAIFLGLTLGVAALTAGCGSGKSDAKGDTKGTTIIVNIAANTPSAELLNSFTAQTGIKVKWVNSSWDDLQTKIAASATSKTYFADVTNVDWSKVGQYAKLRWFHPIGDYLDTKAMDTDIPLLKAFTVKDQVVGVPWDGSFLVTTVNTVDLRKAGIGKPPTTIDEYTRALRTIKERGVQQHPLAIPLAAAEGLSVYWYQLSALFGGAPLDADLKPRFTTPDSPGHKALRWIVDAVKSGLVDPASVNMTDADSQNQLAQHRASSVAADYAGLVGAKYDLPDSSKVVHQVQYVAGMQPHLGNPDGMGIPRTAKHAKAAAEFIRWFTSERTQSSFAGVDGPKTALDGFTLPARLSTLQKMPKAEQLLAMERTVQPVFPGGPPPWYAKFSNAVYTNIHGAAAGSQSVDKAVQQIAATVSALSS